MCVSLQEHAVYAGNGRSDGPGRRQSPEMSPRFGSGRHTLVIFTSDNGGLSTSEGWPTSNAPLRAGKGWLYEGGIREPFLARWPQQIPPGTVIRTPISSPDLFPTLLEAAGVATPADSPTDGCSWLPLFRGETLPERPLFWHYPHYGNQGGATGAAIRRGDWKLIEWFEDQHVELFNLATDLSETTNLADVEPARVEQLRRELHTWQQAVGAKFPDPQSSFRFYTHQRTRGRTPSAGRDRREKV